jgi:hypothetical protein
MAVIDTEQQKKQREKNVAAHIRGLEARGSLGTGRSVPDLAPALAAKCNMG